MFRMAAHVPVNTILLIGMLGARSPFTTGLWQFFNQSFNALQFRANRNASNETPTDTVAISFGAAVCASVGLGYGLRKYFNGLEARAASLSPRARSVVALGNMAVPFLAASAAKPLQIGLMRHDELTEGVAVYDDEGTLHGRSTVAGIGAVSMTTLIRVVYLAPMLYLPALNAALERSVPLLQRSAFARGGTNVVLTAASSAFVTPACMAIFDQRARWPVSSLEPRFHGLTSASGKPIDHLQFNKGL